MAGSGTRRQGEVLERPEERTERPRLYRVLLHNDDYTPMDFVVELLETTFHRSPAEAHRIMMLIHRSGVGCAGVYTHEEAETKVGQVHRQSREAGHPLRASLEAE